MLQVQYADRLLGRLLDALRSSGVFDDAVVVVTADHGASFVTGEPRRPVNRANVGAIAPVPLFVKAPGQRDGRVDDGAVRTIDVLPTIAKAAGAPLPWTVDGMPADEREVDPAAPIDVSHAGEPVLTEPLRSVLAARDARERVEAELLRDGLDAIGPRPDLIGRRVAGGREFDGAPFVTGEAAGLDAGTEIAVAVGGRVAATTRVYRDGGRPVFAALLSPDATEPITAFEIRGDVLRPLQ
jgi:hypothetical protein